MYIFSEYFIAFSEFHGDFYYDGSELPVSITDCLHQLNKYQLRYEYLER
jgi:hypothetical protein